MCHRDIMKVLLFNIAAHLNNSHIDKSKKSFLFLNAKNITGEKRLVLGRRKSEDLILFKAQKK